MPAFTLGDSGTNQLPDSPFASEREMQEFFDPRLKVFFGLTHIVPQFHPKSLEIGIFDVLGVDGRNAPVLLEYKLTPSKLVWDQARHYFEWMDRHHDEVALALKTAGLRRPLNWSDARVLLIAPHFTRDTIRETKPLPYVELVRFRRYHGVIFLEDPTYRPSPDERLLLRHLSRSDRVVRDAFLNWREEMLDFDGISEQVGLKSGISYRHPASNRVIATIRFQRQAFTLTVQRETKDPQKAIFKIAGPADYGPSLAAIGGILSQP